MKLIPREPTPWVCARASVGTETIATANAIEASRETNTPHHDLVLTGLFNTNSTFHSPSSTWPTRFQTPLNGHAEDRDISEKT